MSQPSASSSVGFPIQETKEEKEEKREERNATAVMFLGLCRSSRAGPCADDDDGLQCDHPDAGAMEPLKSFNVSFFFFFWHLEKPSLSNLCI